MAGAVRKSGGRPAAPAAFVRGLPEGGTLIAAGLSGYGKTFWLKRGLEGSRHLVIIDPYAKIDRDARAAGEQIREGWDGHLVTYEELRDNPGPLLESPCRLVVDPDTHDPELCGERIARVLAWIWEVGKTDVLLEEAGNYSRWATTMIHRVATGGGHRKLRLFVSVQSLGRLSIDARRNVQRLLLFPQADESDMAELKRKIGPSREAALRRLKRFDPPVLWEQGQLEGAAQ
jgi:hypothetical protein